MQDTESDITPKTYLGFRLAVGVVGIALIALFVTLGSVAKKQSATTEALATQESLREGTQSPPARE